MDTKQTGNERAAQNTALIWDLPTRLFHLLLIVSVAILAITGFLARENWLDVHEWSGYGLIFLLCFRLIWGIVGGKHARFRNFPLSLAALRENLSALRAGLSRSYIGHTPAGSWMALFLLGCLTVLVISGLIILGGQENRGPLAFLVSYEIGHGLHEVHEVASWILLMAVILHLVAALVETFYFRHPLIASMVHGRKPTAEFDAAPQVPPLRRGVITAAAVALPVLVIGGVLISRPASGWYPVPVNPSYKQECGDCHHAHHPSLRTRAAWGALMASLEDHFGENAQLDQQTTHELRDFLQTHSAEAFDTEVSHRVGRANPKDGPAITQSRFWKRKHRELPKELFKNKAIGSPANCNACHHDADSGRYDDAQIDIPEPKGRS